MFISIILICTPFVFSGFVPQDGVFDMDDIENENPKYHTLPVIKETDEKVVDHVVDHEFIRNYRDAYSKDYHRRKSMKGLNPKTSVIGWPSDVPSSSEDYSSSEDSKKHYYSSSDDSKKHYDHSSHDSIKHVPKKTNKPSIDNVFLEWMRDQALRKDQAFYYPRYQPGFQDYQSHEMKF